MSRAIGLRITETCLRILELCSAAIVLGITSYFLAAQHAHDLPQPAWLKAVEGMSGAATLYTIFGVLLTLCLGGIPFLAFLAVILDICFFGCFIAIAYLYRGGAGSCDGFVSTPLGNGDTNSVLTLTSDSGKEYTPNLHRACKMETACFAIALINLLFFFVSAVLQVGIARAHIREKRAGKIAVKPVPAPAGRRWFKRSAPPAAVPGMTTHNTTATTKV